MNIPQPPIPGEPIAAEYVREMQKLHRSVGAVIMPGMMGMQDASGSGQRVEKKLWPAQSPKTSTTAAATTYPFTPTISGATISFYPGVMNGLVPSNQFDGNANRAFALSDGINYIVLNATTNGQQVTAVAYAVSASPAPIITTTMGACPTSFSWLLTIAAGTSAGGFTLLYSSVGNVVALPEQVFISPLASPQFGLEPFSRWWTWLCYQLVNL